MDDPDDDWETEEQTTCEYSERVKSNVRWILEKGINLGKMVMITGVVMTSAPVVLPPILVVSAVGFACSVPFGLGYTGYACTLNLMSKLLPMPTASPMLEYDQLYDDDTEAREEWKYRIESHDYMEEEEREQMDDLRGGEEERIELVTNENEVPQLEESISQERKREEMLPKEDAPRPSDRTNFREEEGEWGVTESTVEGEGGMGREETGRRRNGSKDEELKPVVERLVTISGEQSDRNVIGKKENIGVVATGVIGEHNKNQTRVKNEEEDIKRGSVGLLEKIKDEGNADDAAKKTKNKKKKKNKKTSNGSAEISLPDVKDQNVISKNITENQESGPEKWTKLEDLMSSQGNKTTAYPVEESEETSVTASRPETTDGGDTSSEVDSGLPSEKIWEQIDALRTIVGYKATPHRSSIDEVKALYVFAGVELPSSFGNEADLTELNNKLRFLMSVVGVK
ncbi:hypothetical protein Leryth_027305 [Lithospermum erythrorhizon]|nr:hypothetical protein Leryth_027305 [Lithospermum erythrorhizon]